ncbi:MAG: hypothetical protein ACKO1L_05765, partial [Brachymonas sp.]
TISALSFFNVGNRHTFGTIFKYDPSAKAAHAKRRAQVVETVVRFVKLRIAIICIARCTDSMPANSLKCPKITAAAMSD